jgi:1-acyl-sn-glycerol-3-phosphate acyltransferase
MREQTVPPAANQEPRPWSEPLRWLFVPWTLGVTYPMILVTTTFWGFMAIALSAVSQRVGFFAGVVWAWCLAWVTWVRVRVEDRQHARPGQSYVIMCNHQGAYDILALYGFLGREFRWVIKQELRKVPFLGWGCAAIGHIFVDRRNSTRAIAALEAAKPRLVGGISVLFFPEGTRSVDGRLLPFKKGGFAMARQLALPILPVSIAGSNRILPKSCYFPRPGTVRVRFHPPIDPADVPDDAALIAGVRAAIESGLDRDELGR